MKLTHTPENLERLILTLHTLRNVTQLLVREKDPSKLIQGVCNKLIRHMGYYNAWVALLDASGALITTAEAGLGKEFVPMAKRLKHGNLTPCAQKALARSEVVLTEDPVSTCKECPLAENYAGRGAMTVRLKHSGKVFGLFCASLPAGITGDLQERGLFQEIADDIAFALHNIELERQSQRANEALQHNMHQLFERVKELNCLYSISRLVDKPGLKLEEILKGIVDIVPLAWQYPDNACARISMDSHTCQTLNFKDTPWVQSANIIVHGDTRGRLEIRYLEERPGSDEGPFFKEEKILLNSIAERIGKIVERKQGERSLRASESRFRDLVESSLVGILIVQNDQVIYKNPELERLFGFIPKQFDLASYENIHPADVEKVKQVYQRLSSGKSRKLDMEFRFYPKGKMDSRSELKWVYCRASSIEHAGKKAILINMMDMTRSKELEHLLIVQDKMASLGRVAAGIAHEIRNPLSGINIYINTLGKLYDRGDGLDKVKEILKNLQSASHKIESVIRRVMDFSKPSAPSLVSANINQPIEEAINLTAVTLRKRGIGIDTELDRDLPQSMMDPRMIEQVILNLINNAVDAMGNMDNDKKIRITSSMENDRIFAKISDSGPGVPSMLRDKIFDPFYTTKKESTGIGLNLCYRIISDHGGSITVDTSEWGGAEFTILFPKNPGAKLI